MTSDAKSKKKSTSRTIRPKIKERLTTPTTLEPCKPHKKSPISNRKFIGKTRTGTRSHSTCKERRETR